MPPSRRAVLAALALGLAAGPVLAAAVPAAPLSDDDRRDVARAVAYLEALAHASGRFTQTDARGGRIGGTFVLQRPGRARFDYDAPSGVTIASDGRRVYELDRRLKTFNAYPLALTPLALFLARDIRLDRGVAVRQVKREAGALTIVAADAHHPNGGAIALNFRDAPLALQGWTLTDARGGAVTVRLEDFGPSAAKDPSFFVLTDPRPAPDAGALR